MSCRFIAAETARYPVQTRCRCLGVTQSGVYAWERRPASPHGHSRWRLRINAGPPTSPRCPRRPGWCDLAVVLDLGSRRVVGWAMRASLGSSSCWRRCTSHWHAGRHRHCISSDRGSQYESDAYRELLAQRGIAVSMSRVGNGGDNAPVESCFSSLKAEFVSPAQWTTHDEAEAAVADDLRFYNQQRLHSALHYQSPVQYDTSLEAAG